MIRPDDLPGGRDSRAALARVAVAGCKRAIEDAVIGCAFPEGRAGA